MIISIFNIKGGCAKTTTALFIAQELHNRGYQVQVWDADYQRTAVRWDQKADLPFPVLAHNPKSLSSQKVPEDTVVIVDCSPGDKETMSEILKISDAYVIPMKAKPIDVDQGLRVMNLIKSDRILPLLTMVNKRTRAYKEVVELFTEKYPQFTTGVFGKKLADGFGIKNLESHSAQSYQPITDTLEYKFVVDVIVEKWGDTNE